MGVCPSRAAASAGVAPQISPGDQIPSVNVDFGFNPIEKINMLERTKNRKVPAYLNEQDELKDKGVDEVLVLCVNDGAVMEGWAREQKVNGGRKQQVKDCIITFLADTRAEFSKAVGMMIDHPGPLGALGSQRCKRYVLIVENGKVANVEVSEAPDDPAGDNKPDGPVTARTRVEHVLELLDSTSRGA